MEKANAIRKTANHDILVLAAVVMPSLIFPRTFRGFVIVALCYLAFCTFIYAVYFVFLKYTKMGLSRIEKYYRLDE